MMVPVMPEPPHVDSKVVNRHGTDMCMFLLKPGCIRSLLLSLEAPATDPWRQLPINTAFCIIHQPAAKAGIRAQPRT